MGGDGAPGVVVEGAVRAVRELGLPVTLVGDEARILAELDRLEARGDPRIALRAATEVVAMDEAPAHAVRRKRDASIRVVCELVERGEAAAAMSAGNSGALLASALLCLGRLPQVERPGVLTYLPTRKGPVGLTDAGANVEVKPLHLVQFALLGEAWTRIVHGVARPRVAVLSNGEEPGKGTELTRAAHAALARDPSIDFRGYAEGKDLFAGELDLVATDGFTGNVVLKTAEGIGTAFVGWIRESLGKDLRARAGGLLLEPALRELSRKVDFAEYGGAPLVGCAGTVVLAHGRSGPLAIRNAIRAAAEAAAAEVREALSEAAGRAAGLLGSDAPR